MSCSKRAIILPVLSSIERQFKVYLNLDESHYRKEVEPVVDEQTVGSEFLKFRPFTGIVFHFQ